MPHKARTSNKSASSAPRQYQIISRPSSSDTLTAQPPPGLSQFKVSRNTHNMLSSVSSPQEMPVTPPRPKSMQSLPPHGSNQSVSPFPESKSKGPAIQSYGHAKATLSPPLPRTLSDTPGRRPKSQTPSRSSGTPSQAYAGPLFHASPAASALPIPKWFSKTINERKVLLEENTMETVAKKPSPEQSDDSPTLRKSRIEGRPFPDEPPPKYDVPTDLAEKGKGLEGNAMPVLMDEESCISPSLSASTLVDSSASPDTDGPHHPRHGTRHPSRELFPLKAEEYGDSSIPKQGGHLQRKLSESARPTTAPSYSSAQTVEDEEQRKARSLALKTLLQTPVSQSPVSASSHLRIIASDNESRPFPPARNLSGPSSSMSSRAIKLPYKPYNSHFSSTSPPNIIEEMPENSQHPHEATQRSTPHHKPDTFDTPKKDHDFDGYGMVYARTENRPFSYGKRATLMEGFQSHGSNFRSKPSATSSQFYRGLDSTSSTNDYRTKLSEDHNQRDGSTCSCKFPISPQQSSSNIERSTLQDDTESEQMKDSSRSGNSFKPRPAISSPQSYPGANSTPVEHYDPKKWLENHLRHDILKIGNLVSDGATGVAA